MMSTVGWQLRLQNPKDLLSVRSGVMDPGRIVTNHQLPSGFNMGVREYVHMANSASTNSPHEAWPETASSRETDALNRLRTVTAPQPNDRDRK